MGEFNKKDLFYTMLLTRILAEVSNSPFDLLWGIVSLIVAVFLALCFYFQYVDGRLG